MKMDYFTTKTFVMKNKKKISLKKWFYSMFKKKDVKT